MPHRLSSPSLKVTSQLFQKRFPCPPAPRTQLPPLSPCRTPCLYYSLAPGSGYLELFLHTHTPSWLSFISYCFWIPTCLVWSWHPVAIWLTDSEKQWLNGTDARRQVEGRPVWVGKRVTKQLWALKLQLSRDRSGKAGQNTATRVPSLWSEPLGFQGAHPQEWLTALTSRLMPWGVRAGALSLGWAGSKSKSKYLFVP